MVRVLNFRSTISRGFTFLSGFIKILTQKNTYSVRLQGKPYQITNKTKTEKYIPGSECGVKVYYGAMLFYENVAYPENKTTSTPVYVTCKNFLQK